MPRIELPFFREQRDRSGVANAYFAYLELSDRADAQLGDQPTRNDIVNINFDYRAGILLAFRGSVLSAVDELPEYIFVRGDNVSSEEGKERNWRLPGHITRTYFFPRESKFYTILSLDQTTAEHQASIFPESAIFWGISELENKNFSFMKVEDDSDYLTNSDIFYGGAESAIDKIMAVVASSLTSQRTKEHFTTAAMQIQEFRSEWKEKREDAEQMYASQIESRLRALKNEVALFMGERRLPSYIEAGASVLGGKKRKYYEVRTGKLIVSIPMLEGLTTFTAREVPDPNAAVDAPPQDWLDTDTIATKLANATGVFREMLREGDRRQQESQEER